MFRQFTQIVLEDYNIQYISKKTSFEVNMCYPMRILSQKSKCVR